MSSILLIAPEASNIYQIILEGFTTFSPKSESEVMLLTTPTYHYKSKKEKIANFLFKTFLNRNVKKIYHNQVIEQRLAVLQDRYDLIFIIRPDLLSNHHLSIIKSKTQNFIAYYWDSMVFFPRKKDIIPFFDKVYSFDSQDCKENEFKLLTKFLLLRTRTC